MAEVVSCGVLQKQAGSVVYFCATTFILVPQDVTQVNALVTQLAAPLYIIMTQESILIAQKCLLVPRESNHVQ